MVVASERLTTDARWEPVPPNHMLILELERLDGIGLRPIRQPQQESGDRDAQVRCLRT